MCQIGGIINIQMEDKQSSELIEQVAKIMLTKMADGNPHGSGVVVSYQDHEGFFTLKSPNKGDAIAQVLQLDQTKPFKHILLHTRYATQGAITEVNSHPHLGPTGAIVHNGWCPELYNSIEDNWHHNAAELRERLADFNETGKFVSECDTEALALIFNEDPAEFSKNLVGDEVFAIAHLDNSGNRVSLFTQYNTVNMAYSHALGAVIFATRRDVVETVLDFLGEAWPVTELPSDSVYYFDGSDMTGGSFDFTEAAMENMENYYSRYRSVNKSNTTKVYDSEGHIIDDERDDLDTYFKARDAADNKEWTRTVMEDGSTVWEHTSGEIVNCSAENTRMIDECLKQDKNDPEESLAQYMANLPEETGDGSEPDREFLDKDFSKVQETIRQQIMDEFKDQKGD